MIKKYPNQIEVNTYSYFTFQTIEILCEDPTINQALFVRERNQMPQVNQEITTRKIMGNHITRTPY